MTPKIYGDTTGLALSNSTKISPGFYSSRRGYYEIGANGRSFKEFCEF